MLRWLVSWTLLFTACGAGSPAPDEPLPAPIALLSHADDPLELLAFEEQQSHAFLRDLARALEAINREALAAGEPPIQWSLVHRRHDRERLLAFDLRFTPLVRIPVSLEKDLWLQDVVEIGSRGGRSVLVDARRGAHRADPVLDALSERWGAARLTPAREPERSVANGAGNVEVLPDGTLLLGNTAGPVLAEYLFAAGYRDRHARVDTSFLKVGHVDELLSHVVTGTGPCDFVLLHASPRLGLAFTAGDPGRSLQLRLEARIARSVAEIRRAVARQTPHCGLRAAPLPIVFLCEDPAAERGCVPAWPNPVNMTVLRRHVLVADPGGAAVRAAISETLRSLGQTPHFLDASIPHDRRGGVHCITNVRRVPARERTGAARMAP